MWNHGFIPGIFKAPLKDLRRQILLILRRFTQKKTGFHNLLGLLKNLSGKGDFERRKQIFRYQSIELFRGKLGVFKLKMLNVLLLHRIIEQLFNEFVALFPASSTELT